MEIPGVEVQPINTETTNTNISLVDQKKVDEAQKRAKDQAEAMERARVALLGGNRVCQRCGHDTTIETIVISEQDKAAFLASIIGDTGYQKKFYAMGKLIEITLCAAPAWFMTLIKDQLVNDHRLRLLNTMEEYRITSYQYCLTGCLSEIRINGVIKYSTDFKEMLNTVNIAKRDDRGDTVIKNAFAILTKDWSDVILSAVTEAQSKFNEELDVLMKHASDPSFWESVKVS